MAWLFVAMVATGMMWCAWGVIFIGLGGLVSRVCGQRFNTWEDVLLAFWVGLALTMGLLQLWHLALPIDSRAGVCMTILGAAGFALHIRQIAMLIRRLPRLSWPMVLVGLIWLIFIVWLANRAINLPLDTDSAQYHLPLIEWQRRFAIVPGIANIESGFTYNNTSFLYATLLDNGIWQYHGYHFVTSLPMAVLSLMIVLYTVRWLRDTSFSYEYGLAPLLAGLLIMLTVSVSISSPNSDYIVFYVAIVLFFQYIQCLRETTLTSPAHYRIFVIVVLCITGISIKISQAPFFGLVAVFTLGRWLWLSQQTQRPLSRRLIMALVGSAAFLVIPWIIRSIIINGYAAFPITAISLPVDWRIPDKTIADMVYAIRIVGFDYQIPESTLAVWTWVPHWLQGMGKDIYFVYVPVLWLVALFIVSIGLWLRGLWERPRGAILWLMPLMISLLVWFFSSPHIKYASGLIWMFTAALTIVVFRAVRVSVSLKKWALIGVALLFMAYPVFLVVRAKVVITQPGEDYGFYGVTRFDLPYRPFVTRSGLTIWTGPECYYNALPCSRWRFEGLSLRVPGDLSQGFRIDPDP